MIKPEKLTIAIETSGRVGSVAVGHGCTLINEVIFSGFMRHSAELFTALENLLKKVNATPQHVKYCYITAGPGSFTGLRIAVTVSKMLNFAGNVQIIAADTMDVIAENAPPSAEGKKLAPDCIATILDAKKNFFYTAVFDQNNGLWQKCMDTQIMTAEDLLNWLESNNKQNVGLLGEGLLFYAEKFRSPFTTVLDERTWSAKAAGLLQVGHRMAEQGLFADPLTLTPKYLRQPDAVVKTTR